MDRLHPRNIETLIRYCPSQYSFKIDWAGNTTSMTVPHKHNFFCYEHETLNLNKPNDNALIIRLDVGCCQLSRITINTESLTDILFDETFKNMVYHDSTINLMKISFVSFNGTMTHSLGSILLVVNVEDVQQQIIQFTIMDQSAPLYRTW